MLCIHKTYVYACMRGIQWWERILGKKQTSIGAWFDANEVGSGCRRNPKTEDHENTHTLKRERVRPSVRPVRQSAGVVVAFVCSAIQGQFFFFCYLQSSARAVDGESLLFQPPTTTDRCIYCCCCCFWCFLSLTTLRLLTLPWMILGFPELIRLLLVLVVF